MTSPRFRFEIDSWEEMQGVDPLEAATYASFRIRLDDQAVTLVYDKMVKTTRDVVRVSTYPLAMWLAGNWWRLRWETKPDQPGLDWQMSHRLGGAGHGYIWPDIEFVSNGEQIQVDVLRHAASQFEPISYLNPAKAFLFAHEFESAATDFIEIVVARLHESNQTGSPLSEIWRTIQDERADQSLAQTRRIEAMLGFDADEAPPHLLSAYSDGAKKFGEEAVAELAAAAVNADEPPQWDAISASLQDGQEMVIKDWEPLKRLAASVEEVVPWRRGEELARKVRSHFERPRGPLDNAFLHDWLGLDPSDSSSDRSLIATFGLRPQSDSNRLQIRHRSRYETGRRFELLRLLSDHLVGAPTTDALLAVTPRVRTARQKVQRAFAAELLVPSEELKERLGRDPSDDAIEETAEAFNVSPRLVLTSLANKGLIDKFALL